MYKFGFRTISRSNTGPEADNREVWEQHDSNRRWRRIGGAESEGFCPKCIENIRVGLRLNRVYEILCPRRFSLTVLIVDLPVSYKFNFAPEVLKMVFHGVPGWREFHDDHQDFLTRRGCKEAF